MGPGDTGLAGPGDMGPSDKHHASLGDTRHAGPGDKRHEGPGDTRHEGPGDTRHTGPTDTQHTGPDATVNLGHVTPPQCESGPGMCVTPRHSSITVTPPPAYTPSPPFTSSRPAQTDILPFELPELDSRASQEPSEQPHHVGEGQVVGEVDPDETLSAGEEDNFDDSNPIQENPDSDQLDDQETASDCNIKKRKRKQTKKEDMAEKMQSALAAWKANQFVSIAACANHFKVPRTTLGTMIREKKDKWRGRGKTSRVFSDEEEELIKENIIERCELGVGLTIEEVDTHLSLFRHVESEKCRDGGLH